MARISKWKSYHVKLGTLEDAAGVMFQSFREMYPKGEEGIAIRVPRDKWEYYGIEEALIKLGFTNQKAVYINM